jgi:hypothetical protein
MKKRCTGLAVVLVSLVAFGVAKAQVEFHGIVDPKLIVTRVDSVNLYTPDFTFFTPGWGSHLPMDTFHFTGVTAWPASMVVHGTGPMPFHQLIQRPDTGIWYNLGWGTVTPFLKLYGTGPGVEESKPAVERLQCLNVSPSVVTGQMTVRLQPVGTGRPVVEIHDAVGNVIRSLNCTAGANGAATATWNRKDDFGRLVPEGVYFCRYAASGAAAVRKVLVAH